MLVLTLEANRLRFRTIMGWGDWPLAVGYPAPYPRCLHVATAGKSAACTLMGLEHLKGVGGWEGVGRVEGWG